MRDGVTDVREGRPPYFWTILTRPDQRMRLLREGWTSVGRVLAIGAAMDAIYQLMVFRWIYLPQLVVVTLGVVFVPYVLLRGPIGRLYRWWTSRRTDYPLQLRHPLEKRVSTLVGVIDAVCR